MHVYNERNISYIMCVYVRVLFSCSRLISRVSMLAHLLLSTSPRLWAALDLWPLVLPLAILLHSFTFCRHTSSPTHSCSIITSPRTDRSVPVCSHRVWNFEIKQCISNNTPYTESEILLKCTSTKKNKCILYFSCNFSHRELRYTVFKVLRCYRCKYKSCQHGNLSPL